MLLEPPATTQLYAGAETGEGSSPFQTSGQPRGNRKRESVMAELIGKHNLVHRLEKRPLLIAVNCLAGLAIFFFGYDQGMMGSVNVSIDYGQNKMKFGHEENGDLVVDNSLLQGGIVSLTRFRIAENFTYVAR